MGLALRDPCDLHVNFPAPHRDPKLGGRVLLGSLQSLPALVPSLPSSRDDVIGKVCLTRDTLVTHPKGKISGREPTAHSCFPYPGLPFLSPHWSAQSLAFPLLKGPFSRLLQDPCSGKAISTLPRRACVHLLHTRLRALGPVPLGWDLIDPEQRGWLLVVGSEAFAGMERGLLMPCC